MWKNTFLILIVAFMTVLHTVNAQTLIGSLYRLQSALTLSNQNNKMTPGNYNFGE